jgi:hypothetical protein
MFKPISTKTALSAEAPTKVLIYAHHGFGKTYQCRKYQERYGPGFIISGEAGLKSIGDIDIDYLPFDSWDGPVDPDNGKYSFRSLIRYVNSPEFKAKGYKWIAIDSLTELADRVLEQLQQQYPGEKDGFKVWGEYDKLLTASLKWIRDLPLHVYVTCLAKEEKNSEDMTDYWPSLKGQAVSKKVPAIFDHVFCGVRVTDKDPQTGVAKVRRLLITDEVNGWHGKARDPQRRLKPIEPGDDVTALLAKMTNS